MPIATEQPSITNLRNTFQIPYNCKYVQENAGPMLWRYEVLEVPSAPGMLISDLERWKMATFMQLNGELQTYIYTKYDSGTQATINGYATKALFINRTDIVAECQKLQNWVDDVLVYYDTKKVALLSATDEETRKTTTWDFTADVPLVNYIDWRTIKAMFT